MTPLPAAIQLPMVERRVNGLRFDVIEHGPAGGAPVLLLHGFPQTAQVFVPLIRRLAHDGMRVVAPNQRGYSPGARPLEVEAYSWQNTVSDALALMTAVGWDSAHVVGHSWGGWIGWYLAGLHPARVRSLTALSTPHPAAFKRAMDGDELQQVLSQYMGLFRSEGLAEERLSADGYRRLRRTYHAHASDLPSFSTEGALTGMLNWYRAMRRTDGDQVGDVNVPVTYVWGTLDQAFSPRAADLTRSYARSYYRFVRLEGATHWLHEEQLELVGDEIVARVEGTR